MASIWAESVAHSFEQALDLLAAAVQDCTGELWETAMWQVLALPLDHQFLDRPGSPSPTPLSAASCSNGGSSAARRRGALPGMPSKFLIMT
jgi:hypothetical protein